MSNPIEQDMGIGAFEIFKIDRPKVQELLLAASEKPMYTKSKKQQEYDDTEKKMDNIDQLHMPELRAIVKSYVLSDDKRPETVLKSRDNCVYAMLRTHKKHDSYNAVVSLLFVGKNRENRKYEHILFQYDPTSALDRNESILIPNNVNVKVNIDQLHMSIADMMTGIIKQFFSKNVDSSYCPVYWSVSTNGTMVQNILPANIPLQEVDENGVSIEVGVVVPNDDECIVQSLDEEYIYNGLKIFDLDRSDTEKILKGVKNKVINDYPIILIRKGSETTIGSDGTFKNLVLSFIRTGTDDRVHHLLFSFSQGTKKVQTRYKSYDDFEDMIKQVTKAERINYLFTFNTIAGLDPVEVEIKQYVDKYRPVQSVAIQHDPNWQDGVRFSGDGRWIMPNTSLV